MSHLGVFPIVVEICLVWLSALVAVLSLVAARAGSLLERVLWVDTLALSLMAWLALVAYARSSPHYLDAALILGLLAFAGTLAATHYHDTGSLR